MAFDPKYLAPTVYEAYKQGPIAWVFVVRTAVAVGYKNLNTLTDIAFYIHHPELNGKPIKVEDKKLIAQWKGFRKLIKTALPGLCKPMVKSPSDLSDKDNNTDGTSKSSLLDYDNNNSHSHPDYSWTVEEAEA